MKACRGSKKKWRRGQDSNLHILSDGGFQDRCTTIMRPLRSRAAETITYRREVAQEVRPEGPTVSSHVRKDVDRAATCVEARMGRHRLDASLLPRRRRSSFG